MLFFEIFLLCLLHYSEKASKSNKRLKFSTTFKLTNILLLTTNPHSELPNTKLVLFDECFAT